MQGRLKTGSLAYLYKVFKSVAFSFITLLLTRLRHKTSDDLMIYPGYIPRPGVVPILLHYGLPIKVGNWSFSKLEHHKDGLVYECNRLFPESPCPRELNLRHIINRDILIYPGYIPEPGIQYKVFHNGLKFSVGNWSFDKADWRDSDLVNTCWAKFPEPPDPSTLSHADENILQRDLLSIECGQALNKALDLHHKRRGCNSPNVIANVNPPPSNNLIYKGSDGDVHSTRNLFVPIDVSNSSSIHGPSKEHGSPRIWMVGLWALSVLGFLAVISMPLSRHKEEGARIKGKRRKKSHVGLPEAIGGSYKIHGKNIYNAEIVSDD